MSVSTSLSLLASLAHPFDSALIGSRQEEERGPATPAQAPAERPVRTETQPAVNFKEVVRANLRAAAQHSMLGHEAPSFRECSRPSCRNASNLIPYPVDLAPGVTEADLEAILEKMVPAALEQANASSPVQAEPEYGDQPVFIA